MADYSLLIEEYFGWSEEELNEFFRWVATLEPGFENPQRQDFIRQTKKILAAGGDPSKEVKVPNIWVSPSLGPLVSEWLELQQKSKQPSA